MAADLGTMLDTMRAQQAAVEDRVTSMQSAVLQLVPEAVSFGLAQGNFGKPSSVISCFENEM